MRPEWDLAANHRRLPRPPHRRPAKARGPKTLRARHPCYCWMRPSMDVDGRPLAAIMRLGRAASVPGADHRRPRAARRGLRAAAGMVMLARQMGYNPARRAGPLQPANGKRDATLRLRRRRHHRRRAVRRGRAGSAAATPKESHRPGPAARFLADPSRGQGLPCCWARTGNKPGRCRGAVREDLLHYSLVRRTGESQAAVIRRTASQGDPESSPARTTVTSIAGTPGTLADQP